jgi:hypothetical protein
MSLSTPIVNSVLQEISSGKGSFDLCSLNSASSTMKLIDSRLRVSESASPTERISAILSGKFGNFPVNLKCFLDDGSSASEGLLYEAKVYKKIVSEIFRDNYSPNFIPFVGFAICTDRFFKSILSDYDYITFYENIGKKIFFRDPEDQTKKSNLLADAYHKKFIERICILMTENAGNGAYFNCPDAVQISSLELIQELSKKDVNDIMFQVIYSLEVMQRFKISHNDLHQGNILLATFKDPIKMAFKVEGMLFEINTRYVPYLFDWDFSYAEGLGDNKKLYQYYDLNLNNTFTTKSDLYILACSLSYLGIHTVLDSYLTDIAAMKESRRRLPVDDAQRAKLENIPPIFDNVRKLSGNQAREIFGNIIPDTVTYIMVEGSFRYEYNMYNPFPCRLTFMDSSFPSCVDLLKTKFNDLRVDDSESKLVYKLPKNKTFIDPHQVETNLISRYNSKLPTISEDVPEYLRDSTISFDEVAFKDKSRKLVKLLKENKTETNVNNFIQFLEDNEWYFEAHPAEKTYIENTLYKNYREFPRVLKYIEEEEDSKDDSKGDPLGEISLEIVTFIKDLKKLKFQKDKDELVANKRIWYNEVMNEIDKYSGDPRYYDLKDRLSEMQKFLFVNRKEEISDFINEERVRARDYLDTIGDIIDGSYNFEHSIKSVQNFKKTISEWYQDTLKQIEHYRKTNPEESYELSELEKYISVLEADKTPRI